MDPQRDRQGGSQTSLEPVAAEGPIHIERQGAVLSAASWARRSRSPTSAVKAAAVGDRWCSGAPVGRTSAAARCHMPGASGLLADGAACGGELDPGSRPGARQTDPQAQAPQAAPWPGGVRGADAELIEGRHQVVAQGKGGRALQGKHHRLLGIEGGGIDAESRWRSTRSATLRSRGAHDRSFIHGIVVLFDPLSLLPCFPEVGLLLLWLNFGSVRWPGRCPSQLRYRPAPHGTPR